MIASDSDRMEIDREKRARPEATSHVVGGVVPKLCHHLLQLADMLAEVSIPEEV